MQATSKAIVAATLLAASASTALAAALEWSKIEVKTSSEKVCMRFASDVAREKGLQNIRTIPIEVAGTKSNVYVSMTCVGRDGHTPAIAMVIAVSDDAGAAVSVRDELATALKGITCFDSCN